MKKLLTLLMIFGSFALTSCGGGASSETDGQDSTEVQEPAPETVSPEPVVEEQPNESTESADSTAVTDSTATSTAEETEKAEEVEDESTKH